MGRNKSISERKKAQVALTATTFRGHHAEPNSLRDRPIKLNKRPKTKTTCVTQTPTISFERLRRHEKFSVGQLWPLNYDCDLNRRHRDDVDCAIIMQ